jgi:hypothetical protein
MYFNLLNANQKIEALKTQKLPTTTLRCNKYHWDIQNNLGDIATDILFKMHFPFFEFDKNEKNNLLMFGGTIFNHIENANKLYDADFKNILYFGVGVSQLYEIESAMKTIKENNISFTMIPRGPKTKMQLMQKFINTEEPCGDVLQLCSSLPIVKHNLEDPELLVEDVYHPNLIAPKSNNYKTIKVANNNKSLDVPFYGFNEFIDVLNNHSRVYSSQVHPFLISALLGKPCVLHPKDWRARDFTYFSSFKPHMDLENCYSLREEAQQYSKVLY